ncbi:heat shock protein 60A [Scaptodrosophila lebanonensis]|uniref:Heat shock protein 60A n=1 Tax=Drosophila lebanonensis TaxID=7225 RepID=A0A6J2TRW9_DROLE|nr:heat shock protein 60A [Scaptodrosophila lebanonensis]
MLRRCKRYGQSFAHQALRYYAKDVRFGVDARNMLLKGVDVMTDAVSSTLGPKGRNAIIERLLGSPRITKDGITVADNVQLQDRGANVGAQLIRHVANNTNNGVGDGTTTATILARSIASQGCELIHERGANAQQLREGVLRAAQEVCAALTRMSQPLERIWEVEAVARNALNGDVKLAGLIGDGIYELGERGVFLLKDSKTLNDTIEVLEGVTIEQGYISPRFLNQPTAHKVEFTNALLLLTLVKIEQVEEIIPALESAKDIDLPLVIIAPHISEEVLSMLLLNQICAGMQVCAVQAPGHGDKQKTLMEDLAIATNGRLLENVVQLQRVETLDFAMVGEAVISAKATHLLRARGDPDEVHQRVQYIRELIKEAGTDDEVNELNERLASLLASVAMLYVGGANEMEVSEKKDRLNDALNAVSVAISDGIVPGGGTAYLRCIEALEALPTSENVEQNMGVEVVKNALRLPCATIASNAGANAQEVLMKVMQSSGNYGYDAAHNEYCDLVERGIIDPTNVLRSAITDAAGIGSMLATTEVLITEQPIEVQVPKNQVTRDLASLIGM